MLNDLVAFSGFRKLLVAALAPDDAEVRQGGDFGPPFVVYQRVIQPRVEAPELHQVQDGERRSAADDDDFTVENANLVAVSGHGASQQRRSVELFPISGLEAEPVHVHLVRVPVGAAHRVQIVFDDGDGLAVQRPRLLNVVLKIFVVRHLFFGRLRFGGAAFRRCRPHHLPVEGTEVAEEDFDGPDDAERVAGAAVDQHLGRGTGSRGVIVDDSGSERGDVLGAAPRDLHQLPFLATHRVAPDLAESLDFAARIETAVDDDTAVVEDHSVAAPRPRTRVRIGGTDLPPQERFVLVGGEPVIFHRPHQEDLEVGRFGCHSLIGR